MEVIDVPVLMGIVVITGKIDIQGCQGELSSTFVGCEIYEAIKSALRCSIVLRYLANCSADMCTKGQRPYSGKENGKIDKLICLKVQ